MKTLHHRYVKGLYEQLGYTPVWMPTTTVALGDVGTIADGVFRRVSNVQSVGLTFNSKLGISMADIEYRSSEKVAISYKAVGAASDGVGLAEADGGIVVSLKDAAGVLVDAASCTVDSISDVDVLGVSVLKRAREGRWDSEHIVVTEVVRAASATVVIASGRSGELVLRGAASAVGRGFSSTMDVVSEKGVGFKLVGATNLTPFFRSFRVKRGILGKKKIEMRSGSEAQPQTADGADELSFEAVDPREYL